MSRHFFVIDLSISLGAGILGQDPEKGLGLCCLRLGYLLWRLLSDLDTGKTYLEWSHLGPDKLWLMPSMFSMEGSIHAAPNHPCTVNIQLGLSEVPQILLYLQIVSRVKSTQC